MEVVTETTGHMPLGILVVLYVPTNRVLLPAVAVRGTIILYIHNNVIFSRRGLLISILLIHNTIAAVATAIVCLSCASSSCCCSTTLSPAFCFAFPPVSAVFVSFLLHEYLP